MARTPYASRIRARIQEIEVKLDALKAELEELRVAERVLGRLGNEDAEVTSEPKASGADMTVREAIIQILTQSSEPWLGAQDIQRELEQLYGRPVSKGTVGPNLTRLKNEDVVERDGHKVALRKRIEAPASAEASNQVGSVAERFNAPDSKSGGDPAPTPSPAGSNPAASADPSAQASELL